MGLARQIGLLMWKNWLLQKRRICVSIFEILLPVAFAIIFLIIRSLVQSTDKPVSTYYPSSSIILSKSLFQNNSVIGFAPNTSETIKVMKYVHSMLENNTFKGSNCK